MNRQGPPPNSNQNRQGPPPNNMNRQQPQPNNNMNRQQPPPPNTTQTPPPKNNMMQPSGVEMQKVTNINQRNPSPNFTPPGRQQSNLNNSNLGRSQSPVGTPKRGMSAKQRRFYERLQNHKKMKASSPSPINNSRVQINRGMEVHYDS